MKRFCVGGPFDGREVDSMLTGGWEQLRVPLPTLPAFSFVTGERVDPWRDWPREGYYEAVGNLWLYRGERK